MRKIYNLLTLLVVWSASMSTSFAQLSLTTSFTDNTCYGSCDGTITCSVTGQQGPVEYSVDGGATYQSGTMFSGLCRGTYTVIARDSALVMDSSTITVNEPSQLVPYVIITDALLLQLQMVKQMLAQLTEVLTHIRIHGLPEQLDL